MISTSQLMKNNWIEGTVINYNSSKGFAFLRPLNNDENTFIPPHLVKQFELSEGQKINGTIEEYIDNRSGEQKTRVNNIKT